MTDMRILLLGVQVFCDLNLKVQHLLLHSWYYGSQGFASITTSSPQRNKKMNTKYKNYKTIQDDGTLYVWFTLDQLQIASCYETKYRYLNSRQVGASCSASPLGHDCWRCELVLWCIYRWQVRTLFRSCQCVFNRTGRQSLQTS